jgi:hypothetical protein
MATGTNKRKVLHVEKEKRSGKRNIKWEKEG